MELRENERLDYVNDDIELIQNTEGLTFGTDALLLAGYVNGKHAKGVELGGGTGIISMLLLARDKVQNMDCIEIQDEYAELIKRNAEHNGLGERLNAVCQDVREFRPERECELVISNPPYKKTTSGKENLKYAERSPLNEFLVAGSAKLVLHVPAEVMPRIDVALVDADPGDLQVLADFHLCAGARAGAVDHEVAERAVLIAAPEREEAAEARPEIMDPAAAVRSEERAGDIVATHQQMGQDKSILDMKTDAHIKQLVEALSQVLLELVKIIWVEVYSIIHAPAALAAALTGAAGDPREVAGCHKLCHNIYFSFLICLLIFFSGS